MSKDTTENKNQIELEQMPFTLPAFITFMTEFAKSGQEPITILEDATFEDGEIKVDVNDDFAVMYEKAFTGTTLNEALEEMLSVMVEDYIDKLEAEDTDDTENIPLA